VRTLVPEFLGLDVKTRTIVPVIAVVEPSALEALLEAMPSCPKSGPSSNWTMHRHSTASGGDLLSASIVATVVGGQRRV